ncbi:hypothetical protein TVVG_00001 [Tetraselmis viridis virus SI1]|uniref:hypothetical protein n=1 Tax=Tetraselmis viridis virus S20 TaxID=754070 RepID=UPI0002C14C15|nr:hypothetical protein TVGG_00022 [Tetraselmis viridis virus S20]AGH31350.1 hypothetical protein TVGG_00022 [Tetraselmis viridis virus S20]AGH31384.1 hypothetical protein TVVG_00001 [Tetraselmis viridis virus SI1]
MLYNFKAQFVPAIRSGDKRQTIRAPRKSRHVRPGETVHIYTGPRFQPKKVGEAPCIEVVTIQLNLNDRTIQAHTEDESGAVLQVWTRCGAIEGQHPDRLAQADGFKDWEEMRSWFAQTHGPAGEFRGVLIKWDYGRFYPA